jgi:hypothetical protein
MTLRTGSRGVTKQLMSIAMWLSPRGRVEWMQAMCREVEEIPGDREALKWALGCLQASCHERLKSMRPTDSSAVRWGMALWVSLLAIDTLFYAGITLAYKLGLYTDHYPYPQNVPLIEVTPLWEPTLSLVAGVVFLLAIVLILRRSRVALGAVMAPLLITLSLFAARSSRPESGFLQSLSAAYEKSHFALIWPIVGLVITILICLALWHDRRTPVPH